MQTIKAIETRWRGYRFRSRLEARWAVFFETLGLPWEYEVEGYALSSGCYLPDFWLPTLGAYAEVKATADEFDARHDDLVVTTAATLIYLVGSPAVEWYFARTLAWRNTVPVAVDDFVDFGASAAEGWCRSSQGEVPQTAVRYVESFRRAVDAARGARFEFGEAP